MKIRASLPLIVIIAFIMTPVSAKIWRVDNNAGAPADFTTIQAAHDGAADGDTLYLYGSPIDYGGLTVSKKLAIFGPGYFLNENPETQSNPATAHVTGITFNPGASYSLATGFTSGKIWINTDFITLKRMRIYSGESNGSIYLYTWADAITIQQCYITNSYPYDSGEAIQLEGYNTSVIIANNFIQVAHATAEAILAPTSSHMELSHNVLNSNLSLYNSTIENNIVRGTGTVSSATNVVRNNIGEGTQFDTTNANQPNIDMATVFFGTGSTDGQWQLADGSPAIGAGTEGVDCGMYGGSAPYVLSGVPAIPHIYYLTVPSAAEPGALLQVRVKAKTGD
jgi:hypothetical protein